MSSHYKAFLVVITLAVIAFWFARPVFINFMADEDFVRRRNLWLGLTASAFLVPNFWVHMIFAAILVYRTARKDSNPVALYLLLLLAIPPLEQPIPGFGLVNYIFNLSHIRLLCLVILIPAALKIYSGSMEPLAHPQKTAWLAPDIFLIAYGCFQVFLYVPYSSATDTLRSLLLMVLDLLLPYFVLSRFCVTKEKIIEAMAAFCLSAFILAPLAVVEILKGWLLYDGIAAYWNADTNVGGYLLRGDSVRALASSGNSIVFGNFFAVAIGTWLYLTNRIKIKHVWLGSLIIAGGLISAFSRGPWVGAVVCVFIYYAMGPSPASKLLKLIGITLFSTLVVILSPYGDSVIGVLPFVGTVDAGNVTYRQAINERAILIIGLNPFFGSPYFTRYMEDLRQGQGIIDLLNVYLSIGMAYGLITLSAFVLFFATSIQRGLNLVSKYKKIDTDLAMLGAGLISALSGTLIIIYTASNYLSIPYIYVAIAALLVAFSRLSLDSVADRPTIAYR